MRTAMIAALITVAFALPVCGADDSNNSADRNQFGNNRGGNPQGQGQTVAQKRAEITQHIEERITNSLAEKECVQAAQPHDALQACREKYRPQQRGPQQRGGQQGDGQPSRRGQSL
jgi:hypothetical protein